MALVAQERVLVPPFEKGRLALIWSPACHDIHDFFVRHLVYEDRHVRHSVSAFNMIHLPTLTTVIPHFEQPVNKSYKEDGFDLRA
jgi:hypothetical protein